ncbi:hypothetical protein AYO21_07541 [Fonsecaea monophora]|uniref:Uncharacterized protein n=1 Tax=Fonsecaea monophora TaxID=254056 RepID=A0A177F1T5_9EURO|nr:hypothetical protein AYO21_07541 [Fonsecaea monophora]OAG38208.1 hypothetical protein AYO21_07541 [Fonsecaea monophora]
MALQAPLSQLPSLSAIAPDVFTTLPSLFTSPLQTLRRYRLARLRTEGDVSAFFECRSPRFPRLPSEQQYPIANAQPKSSPNNTLDVSNPFLISYLSFELGTDPAPGFVDQSSQCLTKCRLGKTLDKITFDTVFIHFFSVWSPTARK